MKAAYALGILCVLICILLIIIRLQVKEGFEGQMRYFMTFGGGGQNYLDAANRIGEQARQLGIFDRVLVYTDRDIQEDEEFWSSHGEFVSNNKRGYGYWLWKPYLIKKTMDQMKDGDVLLYCDAGCELAQEKRDKLLSYFDIVNRDSIIGTNIENDIEWNKQDLITRLGMQDHPSLEGRQRQSGILMILKNSTTYRIISEWYELGSDYHMIDDSPSVEENHPSFKEHRHDQSLWSLLTKKYSVYSDETLDDAVEILRNITGSSRL